MADVTITAVGDVSSASARALGMPVFSRTDDQIGYIHYSNGPTLYYQKTSDGGASFAARVAISGTAGTVAAHCAWADWWTPGDTGTLIHFWWFDTSSDDVLYRTLDISSDTLGTQRTVFTGSTAAVSQSNFVSGTKTRSGYLYAAFDIDAGVERGLCRSTDGGTTWSANLDANFVQAALNTCILFPATGTGDDNDCWAVYHDAGANGMSLKMWDSSAAGVVESSDFASALEGSDYSLSVNFYAASIRHSDGHLIAVVMNDRDNAAADMLVFDIASTASITQLTNITTDIDDIYYPAVYIDQLNDDIYVAYQGKRDGSETLDTATKVYYTVSTDDGANWSAGDTAYMEGSAGNYLQVWTPLLGPRFYAMWRDPVGGTFYGNYVNSVVPTAPPASTARPQIFWIT